VIAIAEYLSQESGCFYWSYYMIFQRITTVKRLIYHKFTKLMK